MATIPRDAVDYLTRQVNATSAGAQEAMARLLAQVDWSDVAAARDLVVQAAQQVCDAYTFVSAQAAADFYDLTRQMQTGAMLGAEAVPGYVPDATEGAIRAFVEKIVQGNGVDMFNRLVLGRIDYEVKRAAANSAIANGRRDPMRPRFARVPTGAETCDFCLMLASRGFVYLTSSTAGMNHVHERCDCRIVAGWPGMEVEGYDPDAIYDRWQAALDEKAAARALRNGTTEAEEYARIMRSYGESAKAAKARARSRRK